MESTPKKATEKIGGELRKKLPKKSVGLAGCQNGLLYKGSEGREPDCQIVSKTDSLADPSGRGSAKIGNFLIIRHLALFAERVQIFSV